MTGFHFLLLTISFLSVHMKYVQKLSKYSITVSSHILIFCWLCISIYLFININQLDALNVIISLFQASTCFEHICLSSGGQKLYYTVSGIITPIGGRPVHRLREFTVQYKHESYICGDANFFWRTVHIVSNVRDPGRNRHFHSHCPLPVTCFSLLSTVMLCVQVAIQKFKD